MNHDPQLLQQFYSYLPSLTTEEQKIIEELPSEFHIDVPYFPQEQMHWSGAAVAQMLHGYHRDSDTEQSEIANDAGLIDWRRFNHETLKEDFARYMGKENYVPAVYYPGRHVLPNFPTGIEGADFIARNYEMINDVGFTYFKALMVSTASPVMVRIHFDTEMYPMPEEMAQVLDTCGHALLLVGYNARGFFVHDPWDRATWGGTMGGKEQLVAYADMASLPTVNCCLGMVTAFTPFSAHFDYPRAAIHQDRDIELVVKISLPGVTGITADTYSLESISAELHPGGSLALRTSQVTSTDVSTLCAGQSATAQWIVNTGPDIGSHPVEARIRASLKLPAFRWEKNAVIESATLTANTQRRLDVKDIDWLNKYGRI